MTIVIPSQSCAAKILIGGTVRQKPTIPLPSTVRHRHGKKLAQEQHLGPGLRTACQATATAEAAEPPSDHLTAGPSRAVVVGGSLAGIFTAAVTAPFFDEVVILERDPALPHSFDGAELPDGEAYLSNARARNGSPQFRHLHGLLKGGWDMANAFLPGLEEDALAAGAVKADAMSEAAGVVAGQRMTAFRDCESELWCIQATRAVVEPAMRRRLSALYPNVCLRSGSWVSGVAHGSGAAQGSITGVVLKDGETLQADLVVDASGRLSRVQSWLAAGGYAKPRSVEVNSGVGYSDAVFEVPAEVVDQLGWKSFYARPTAPETRGAVIMLIEGGRMHISAIGYNWDHPPAGAAGQRAFLESLDIPEITDLMRHAKPLWEPTTFRGATNKRRFYEEITLPQNLVVLGDAVCVFNPAYGQGMTTAALQAAALQKQLQACAGASAGRLTASDLGNLSEQAQKAVAAEVDFPFQLATGEDLKYEKTKGERRPGGSPMEGFIADYFKDITLCAMRDENMSLVLREVGHMVKPPQALFAPGIVGKVLLYRLRQLFGRLRPSGLSQSPAAP